jgi:hypothetical protein
VYVRSNEGVLGDLFGAGWLAHHHQYEAEQPVLIPLHQMPERLTVSATDVANDIAV